MAAPPAPWDDGDSFTGVRGIKLSYSKDPLEGAIGLFQATYDKDGQSIVGPAHGSTPPSFQSEKIGLDFPSEYITEVSGYIGESTLLPGIKVVRSLTFGTSTGKHGPYGVEEGTPFNYTINADSRIVGFHGQSGTLLNSIIPYIVTTKDI